LVTEFIVPLEEQVISEQEKKQVVEKETQEIVGQKRRASSASTEMVAAAGGTRRSKRVKVAPTRYVPVVEEVSLESSPRDSSGVLIRNTALPASPPLDHGSATTDETTMNVSNEDTNTDSSQRVSAVQPLQWFIIEETFARHLMSASKISFLSKQSWGTAMCLTQTQETISTVLWGTGAVI
jgi:hypothetical protein